MFRSRYPNGGHGLDDTATSRYTVTLSPLITRKGDSPMRCHQCDQLVRRMWTTRGEVLDFDPNLIPVALDVYREGYVPSREDPNVMTPVKKLDDYLRGTVVRVAMPHRHINLATA